MISWIESNIGTVLIALALTGIVTLIAAKLIKDRKKKGASCGCDCSCCSMCSSCPERKISDNR